MNLSAEYKRFNVPEEKKSYGGLDALTHTLVGKVYKRLFSPARFRRQAEKIYELSLELADLEDSNLMEQVESGRHQFRMKRVKRKSQFNLALARISELSYRKLGMRPFSVQIMGVLAQYHGFVIEMLPGEGKTITAAVAGVLAAWEGNPVHIVTSNDYLASRDADSMRPLFEGCNVSVSCVVAEQDQAMRHANYLCDVVYATSKELLADFLRDRTEHEQISFDRYLIEKLSPQSTRKVQVMRGLYTAIIDEADSVLADEATTPLIISAPTKNEILKEATHAAFEIASKLEIDIDYTVNHKFHEIKFTSLGEEKLSPLSDMLPAIWKSRERRDFLMKQALAAREFYKRDSHYIVNEEGECVIVDEKTGRLMKNRSWGAGLHQAVEAKEGVELTDPTETHTRMSFQRFFRLYKKLSGMSGTLQRLENELWQIYKLPTIRVPKRINNTYKLLPYLLLETAAEKWEAVVTEIISIHETSRPILVGTRTIKESEDLADLLAKSGIECVLLNALYHEEEAKIISIAGERGRITIATNMAGRGTDIILAEDVSELGGLHVISTQRHESVRVDLQLFGRAARQGQAGTVREILSIEDVVLEHLCPKLIRNFLSGIVQSYFGRVLGSKAYHHFQLVADKQSSKIRGKILEKDFSLNQMLSFSR